MTLLELIDRWAIIAGVAVIICAGLGLLSATNFPGLVLLKQLRAFPVLRVLYIAVSIAVFIGFIVCFALIATNINPVSVL